VKFRTAREAWAWAEAKRKGRGSRSPAYSPHVQETHRGGDDAATEIRRVVYGQGGESFGVVRGSDDDLVLYAWSRRECPLCHGYAPLEGEADHVCNRGPEAGRVFWTAGRVRRLRALERRLLRRLRALGFVAQPSRFRGRLVRRGGELSPLAPAGANTVPDLRALEDEP